MDKHPVVKRLYSPVIILAACLVILMLFTACGSAPQSKLSIWRGKNIRSYHYQLRINCFCPPEITSPVTVEVRSGELASIRYTEDGRPVTNEFFNRFTTIDKLFDILREAEERKADRISAEYDPVYGFPTNVFIDYLFSAADEELGFAFTGFTPLQD